MQSEQQRVEPATISPTPPTAMGGSQQAVMASPPPTPARPPPPAAAPLGPSRAPPVLEKNAADKPMLYTIEDAADDEDAAPEMIKLDKSDFVAELPPNQYLALKSICAGKGPTAAAAAANVSRATLYNWQKTDPRFIAALNLWRELNHQEVQTSLYALAAESIKVLMKAVKRGDLRAAMVILRHVKDQSIGSADPKRVAAMLDHKNRAIQSHEAELRAQTSPTDFLYGKRAGNKRIAESLGMLEEIMGLRESRGKAKKAAPQ